MSQNGKNGARFFLIRREPSKGRESYPPSVDTRLSSGHTQSLGKVQYLNTGLSCEEPGCSEQAEWYVTFTYLSFHWCVKHANRKMHDHGFWDTKAAEASEAAGEETEGR